MTYWKTESLEGTPSQTPLHRDVTSEVCVVGGGIAGLTTAYFLSRTGKNVTLIDQGMPGAGETTRTTAHLTCVLDDRFASLIKIHGKKRTALAVHSHETAISSIRNIIRKHKIECDFEKVPGFLIVTAPKKDTTLESEFSACQELSIHHVKMSRTSPVKEFERFPSLQFADQAQFHPGKYAEGLLRTLREAGVVIYPQTQAVHIEGGDVCNVYTPNGVIHAGHVVVATDTPIDNKVSIIHKLAPYRSYVIAGKVPRGSLPFGLYWDTELPYHYMRLHGDTLIVGGSDHRTGSRDHGHTEVDSLHALERWTRAHFPMMGPILSHWSGQIVETPDGLPLIGAHSSYGPNVYIATGFSGNGMTYGTIAGLLITDLIQKRANPWAEVYDPRRIRLRSSARSLKENTESLIQYEDWFRKGEVDNETEIGIGEGRVLRQGLNRVAVYKDPNGECHRLSAKCPHLGGVVRWNEEEKTWDCPCHGSRFSAVGKVMHGPACHDLKVVDEETVDSERATVTVSEESHGSLDAFFFR